MVECFVCRDMLCTCSTHSLYGYGGMGVSIPTHPLCLSCGRDISKELEKMASFTGQNNPEDAAE